MGATWNADDVILYSPNAASPLMSVPATGGTPNAITRLSTGDQKPPLISAFLPDGDRFLFEVLTSAPENEGVYLGALSMASPGTRRLVMAVSSAADYTMSGYLVTEREGVLIAVPFDVRGGSVSGDPITLAQQVASDQQRRRGAFSVSASGLVAYRRGTTTPPVTELAWIRAGPR